MLCNCKNTFQLDVSIVNIWIYMSLATGNLSFLESDDHMKVNEDIVAHVIAEQSEMSIVVQTESVLLASLLW